MATGICTSPSRSSQSTSRPVISGMRMSRSTTSGWVDRASAMPLRQSPTASTTSMPAPLEQLAQPDAEQRVVVDQQDAQVSPPGAARPLRRGAMIVGHLDARSLARLALDAQLAAEPPRPLLHDRKADVLPRPAGPPRQVEADAVVLHQQHVAPPGRQFKRTRTVCAGMLADVGQGLLHNAQQLHLVRPRGSAHGSPSGRRRASPSRAQAAR